MKHTVLFFAILLMITISCEQQSKSQDDLAANYETRDYLTVRKHLDTLNAQMQAQMDSSGTYTIPYTDLQHGEKRLVFFGASHTRDASHPQFALLAKVFREVHPEIAFNEGGQIPEEKHYSNIDSAALHDGETGCLKYLCDASNIKMLNGDMDDKEEFRALQKKIPKDQIYLYMAVERFLNQYKNGRYRNMTLEEAFQKKFIAYLERSEFSLTIEEKKLSYLENLYKHYLGKDMNLESLVEVHEYYLIDEGLFGQVGRATKEVRDQALLKKIDAALDQYDNVFVVFGGSHRIAVVPALEKIIAKERQSLNSITN